MFNNSATSTVTTTTKTKYERHCFLKETPCVTSYVFHGIPVIITLSLGEECEGNVFGY